jgi:predicted Holliday junction resolvase-like endonuclease
MQLTDAQLMTACIAIIVPLAALIHSNSRVSDVQKALVAQMEALKETLRAENETLRAEMKAGFARIEAALKTHELEHHR